MAAQKSPAQIRAEAEAAEYSTYRAKVAIYHEGSIAYQPGHAVPVSNVELYKYDDQGLVEKLAGEDKQRAVEATTQIPDPQQP